MRRSPPIVLADDPSELRIHLLGGLRVALGAHLIPDSAWRLRKTKSLIKLLALAPGHMLHREQALDLLWPDLAPDAAAHNLHQTLYTARRALQASRARPNTYLQLLDETITLAPTGALWIDVEAFETAAELAHRRKESAPYHAALKLYTGELLPEDRYEEWAVRRREALHGEYLRLLNELAHLSASAGQHDVAIATYKRLLDADAAHEEAHRALMRLYALSGHRQLALRQYQHLVEALRLELNAEPDSESAQLYEEILTARFPATAARGQPLESVTVEPVLPLVTARRAARSAPEPSEQTPNNLPAQLARFIGRVEEKREVKRRLALTRMLTLVGSGGCGKTRLALDVALDLCQSGSYADGIWFVDLAALSEPSLVPQALASALGVVEQSGQPLLDRLRAHLKPLHLLLLLDNCEHLIGACAHLAEDLLHSCPRLHILATSREPLRILGELSWRVPSLALPMTEPQTSLDELARSDAVQLFVERASAVSASFTLNGRNAPSVASICMQLDGIPLAIELAAARANALSVEQIAARLTDAFRLLTRGSRTALPRQQTLLALMDWSYALLSEHERMLWRRLSIFAGGFSLAAAEYVCGPGEAEGAHTLALHAPLKLNVLDLLGELVNKSLVQAEPQGDAVRYSLLQTVRLYAHDKLLESLEATLIRQRHRQYYVRLVEQCETELLGPNQSEALARLTLEYDNLLAALVWSKQACEDDPSQTEVSHANALMRLCGALWTFWYARGSLSAGRQWLAEALARRDAISDQARPALIKVLTGAGVLAWAQSDFARAQAYCQQSLELARTLGIDSAMVVASLTVLGMIAQDQGHLSEAIAHYEQSLQLMRAAGNRFGIALALNALAMALRHRAEYARATELFEEGLRLQREIGDRWGMALSLHNLGELALDQGDLSRAQTYNDESEALFRALGNQWGVAITLSNRGEIAIQRGQHDLAQRHLAEALNLLNQLEDKAGRARAIHKLASIARVSGDSVRARALSQQSLTLCAEIGDRLGLVANLAELAALAAQAGQYTRAARLFGAAESIQQSLSLTHAPAARADPSGFIARARETLRANPAQSEVWAAGRALSMEQAVAYALEKDGDD